MHPHPLRRHRAWLLALAALVVGTAHGGGPAADRGAEPAAAEVAALRPALVALLGKHFPGAGAADELVKECALEARDLNGDGEAEVIVTPTIERGKKGNGYFFVLTKRAGKWLAIATLEGRDFDVVPAKGRFPDIQTTWYDGGPHYTQTTYHYQDGHYVEAKSEQKTVEGN